MTLPGLVYTNILETLLIVGSDVELNPGPSKRYPKCEKSVPNDIKIVCSCGYTKYTHINTLSLYHEFVYLFVFFKVYYTLKKTNK